MASRGDELNTRLTVTDDASKVVDKVADKLGDLEDKPHEIEIDADTADAAREVKALDDRLDGLTDQQIEIDADTAGATKKIQALDGRLDELTDDEKQILLNLKSDQAERDLKRLNRELANAEKYDDDEIAIKLAVKGTIEQDLARIREEMESLGDIDPGQGFADKLTDKLSNLPGKFGEVGGKLGGGLGKGLVGGFAALGVGALIVQSLQESWERAGGIRKITGQFRLSADEAGEYGKLAGKLYADNWGESIVEVQQIVATASQRLEDVNGKALEAITGQIIAVSETWGEDYGAIIRSITQLTQNGLAASSQDALDLIVTGFQDGANEADDLLDTIDEYAQHWGAMGLSGEDAFNQIIAGFQGGQRDADKLADAVKEMRLRVVDDAEAVDDAYAELGLSADEVRLKFLAGGPAAKEAFLQVLGALDDVADPIAQNRLAVQLIGTQFEDLGPTAVKALRTIDGKLRETEGAAQDLADTVGEVSPWKDAERNAKGLFGKIGDGFAYQFGPMLEGANEGLDKLSGSLEDTGDVGDAAAGRMTEAMDLVSESIAKAKAATEEHSADTTAAMSTVEDSIAAAKEEFDAAAVRSKRFGDDGVENMGRVETAADLTAEAMGRLNVAIEPPRSAIEIIQGEIDEAASNVRRFGDDGVESMGRVETAAGDAADEIDDITEAFQTLKGEIDDRSAYRDVEGSFDDVRTAAQAAWQASSDGATDADAKVRAADQSVDNLRLEVIEYATEVGNLPPEAVTKILAEIDEGNIVKAEEMFAALSRPRTVFFNAAAAIGDALFGGGTAAPGGLPTQPTGAWPIAVTNGSHPRVNAPASGSGITIQSGAITLNNTQATPEQVVEALVKWQRRNGPL